MSKLKRNKLEIIKDMLGVILLNRHISPTHLLYKSNLSSQMFKDYVIELIEKGFITKTIVPKNEKFDGKKIKCERSYYNLTELGREFLEDYKVINLFLEKYGLQKE